MHNVLVTGTDAQFLTSGSNETLTGIDVLDSGKEWKMAYNMWTNDTQKRPVQPVWPDWFGFLHYCIFQPLWGVDSRCAVLFKPDPITISRKQVQAAARVSTPFCFDYMCDDRAYKTRCTDPQYSKVNNRHWVLNLDFTSNRPNITL